MHRRAFRHAGVTALLEAGACDRIGVPVGLAVRPKGRIARLFDGKGLTPAAAMIAAGMEAVETAAAECPHLPVREATASAFPRDRRLEPSQLQTLSDHRLDPDRVTLWCAGRGVLSAHRIWAPLELVGLGCQLPARHRLGLPASSTGLAAGMSRVDAALAACLEVIERDQLARWLDRAGSPAARMPFASSRRDPAFEDAVERCRAAEVLPMLWRIDDDLGIPAALCQLFDLGADRRRAWAMTSGSASHPLAHIAARQALLEAIQVRIAMRLRTPADWPIPRPHALHRDMITREIAMASAAPAAVPVRDAFSTSHDGPASLLRAVARRIVRRRGVEPVAFRLTPRDQLPAVVRVIVPGFRDGLA